jgi:Flp pilus assembly protein TadG
MKSAKSFWFNHEGSALVEAALLTPMLFAVLFGVLEFSFYFYQQQLIEAGVRDAARYMTRIPITSTTDFNPCNQQDTNGTLFSTYATNIALYGSTNVGTQRVKGWTGPVTISCSSTSYGAGTYADATTIYAISATTSFTDPTLGFFGVLRLKAPSISVTHHERFIGPG